MAGKNKGEWLEIYLLLSLISDPSCITDISTGKSLQVQAVRRLEKEGFVEYHLLGSGLVRKTDINATFEIPEVENVVSLTLSAIKEGKSSFDIPVCRDFINNKLFTDVISRSCSKKNDLELRFANTELITTEKFIPVDVKSLIGSPPAIINVSEAGTFVYEVQGVVPEKLNKSLKAKSFVKHLYEMGGNLKYLNVTNNKFSTNLGSSETLFAHLTLRYLLAKRDPNGRTNHISKLVKEAGDAEALGYSYDHWLLHTTETLRRFIIGSTNSKVMNCLSDDLINGIVTYTKDDRFLFRSFNNSNETFKYIFNRLYFDTGSTSKHNMGRFHDGKFKWSWGVRYSNNEKN